MLFNILFSLETHSSLHVNEKNKVIFGTIFFQNFLWNSFGQYLEFILSLS